MHDPSSRGKGTSGPTPRSDLPRKYKKKAERIKGVAKAGHSSPEIEKN